MASLPSVRWCYIAQLILFKVLAPGADYYQNAGLSFVLSYHRWGNYVQIYTKQ